MSDAQLYAPDYLRMQKDEQLHRIAEMIERMIERKSTLEQKLAKAKSNLILIANHKGPPLHHSAYEGLARTTLAEIGKIE